MNDHTEENPVIPKIPQPIFPEPRRIEIWPGVPTEKKPVPLEGPGHGVREVNDPLPSHTPQPQTGGSGKGGRGPTPPPRTGGGGTGGRGPTPPPPSSDAPKNDGGEVNVPKSNSDAIDAKLPCVDEVSNYWSFRDHEKFGIAVSENGLEKYADAVKQDNPTISAVDARLIAEDFIVQHQFHHFLVDRAVATLEAVLNEELWWPMQNVFSKNTWGFSPLEESMSCAYALRQSKNPKVINGFKTLLAQQPKGYQLCSGDGTKIKTIGGDATHKQALSTLFSGYVQRTETPQKRVLGLDGLMLYESHLDGIGGDPFLKVNGKLEKIKIYHSA